MDSPKKQEDPRQMFKDGFYVPAADILIPWGTPLEKIDLLYPNGHKNGNSLWWDAAGIFGWPTASLTYDFSPGFPLDSRLRERILIGRITGYPQRLNAKGELEVALKQLRFLFGEPDRIVPEEYDTLGYEWDLEGAQVLCGLAEHFSNYCALAVLRVPPKG